MTTRARPDHRPAVVVAFLAAVVTVVVGLLGAGPASAAVPAAQNAVGASTLAAPFVVEPSANITADQRLENNPPRPGIVVATGVAANTVRVFRSGGAAAEGGGISLEQAASAASRNGIDMRMMQLAHEAGGPGYGFTSYTVSGAPFRAANGRFVLTLTDRGLATEADAVNTIAHELNHLREAMRTGMPIVEEGPAIRSGNLAEEFFR